MSSDAPARMSDAEALMWRVERDPALSSTVSNVSILDGAPDVARLRRRMARAVGTEPRLGQRVVTGVGPTPPAWVDDADLAIEHHVRHVALPADATDRDLFALAEAITAEPFDRSRPLWAITVVEGLPGGRAAVVTKFHHTLMDGERALKVSLQFTDFERRPADEGPAPEGAVAPPRPEPGPTPTALDLLRDLAVSSLRLPLALGREAGRVLREPARAPELARSTYDALSGVARVLGDTSKARSPLWTGRSLGRRVEVLRVPLEPVKEAGRRLGATVNTMFVTAAAAAAGAYHRDRGVDIDELRATMAVSTRGQDRTTANAFTLVRLLVPTGVMGPAERAARIEALADAAKKASGSGSLGAVAGVAAALPTPVLTAIARQQSRTVDFGTSNVRGAPFPVYMAGGKVLANYPIGPTGGTAFNLTVLGYAGSLDMGLNVDTGAVDDPARLRALLAEAFGDLVAAGA